MTNIHDRPLAVDGLTSYRYKGRYGWIMIGAKNEADALREAARNTTEPIHILNLQVWNGRNYQQASESTTGQKAVK